MTVRKLERMLWFRSLFGASEMLFENRQGWNLDGIDEQHADVYAIATLLGL